MTEQLEIKTPEVELVEKPAMMTQREAFLAGCRFQLYPYLHMPVYSFQMGEKYVTPSALFEVDRVGHDKVDGLRYLTGIDIGKYHFSITDRFMGLYEVRRNIPYEALFFINFLNQNYLCRETDIDVEQPSGASVAKIESENGWIKQHVFTTYDRKELETLGPRRYGYYK